MSARKRPIGHFKMNLGFNGPLHSIGTQNKPFTWLSPDEAERQLDWFVQAFRREIETARTLINTARDSQDDGCARSHVMSASEGE